jgi:hypothetical protein
MSQIHMVIRPFTADRPLNVGELLTIDNDRRARLLEGQRYSRPATLAEIESATAPTIPVARGRKGAPDAE